jgi:hypothetical protein
MTASRFQVSDAYVHREKFATFGGVLEKGALRLKYYEIAPAEGPGSEIDEEVRRLARASAASYAPQPANGEPELGFVILHRCGETFHFLIICTWRNENELWETVFKYDPPTMAGFADVYPQRPPRATFCLWELGVVIHEKQAWQRFVRTARDAAAADAWLGDVMTGPV